MTVRSRACGAFDPRLPLILVVAAACLASVVYSADEKDSDTIAQPRNVDPWRTWRSQPDHDAMAQVLAPRFWLHVEENIKGVKFQFKREGDKEWTDFEVCKFVEYDSDTPISVRNIGTKTGFIVCKGSSTGDIDDIDRTISSSYTPGSQATYEPGTVVVVAGTVVGAVKGLLNLVGSIFSFTFKGGTVDTEKTLVVETASDGELVVQSEPDGIGGGVFELVCDNGLHMIEAFSDTDPVRRSLQGAGAFIHFGPDGSVEDYECCGVITGRECETCKLGEGACGQGNGTPGCEDPGCCQAVCELDPSCCVIEWDAICADIAVNVLGCAVAICPWDLSGDNTVGTSDLILLLGSWGDPYDTADLIELLGAWGPCP